MWIYDIEKCHWCGKEPQYVLYEENGECLYNFCAECAEKLDCIHERNKKWLKDQQRFETQRKVIGGHVNGQ